MARSGRALDRKGGGPDGNDECPQENRSSKLSMRDLYGASPGSGRRAGRPGEGHNVGGAQSYVDSVVKCAMWAQLDSRLCPKNGRQCVVETAGDGSRSSVCDRGWHRMSR